MSQIHTELKKALSEIINKDSITTSKIESFLGPGKSTTFKGEYDPEQLKMGIKVEMEHTNNKTIAERIAKDHLAELPDYYTRLEKMEKEGEAYFENK